jgi:multicomponent Na+:H+ antiporter subunit E
MPSIPFRVSWRTGFARFLGFVLLWAVLTDGSLYLWWLSFLVVLTGTVVSLRFWPESSGLRWSSVPRFTATFLDLSVRGGADVALRALGLRRGLDPGIVDLPVRLPAGVSRTFLFRVVGLLPGTLATTLDGDRIPLHVLDRTADNLPSLRRLEERVADLFGIALEG